MTAEITIFGRHPIDQEIDALHRQATACSKADVQQACELLQRALNLAVKHRRWPPMDRLVRLPTMLQMAGRFEEALIHFDYLVKLVPDHVAETSTKALPVHAEMLRHLAWATIYDKMRIAAKREHLADLVETSTKLQRDHANKADRLRDRVDRAIARDLDAQRKQLDAKKRRV